MGIFDKLKNKGAQQQAPMSPEESMLRHQSAPRGNAVDEARRIAMLQQQKMMQGQGVNQNGSIDGFKALSQVIGKEQILKASVTLRKYKEGKANLEKRIVDNEQWYKLRHWECMKDKTKNGVLPTSAYLFNCIENKHADAMDNFPSPNVLPREQADKAEAEMLSAIIPVVLDQNDFENTYSNVQRYKLKMGTGV